MSDIFIRRPVMTVLTMLTILLFGLIAYKQLPVSDLPNVDYPTINITATLPGASPDTMASSVATVLEKEFSSIAGIDSMSSVSTTGRTQITLQFSLERDIDSAAQDVQAAISSAARRLPDGMPAPPSFRKSNPADLPILYISLSSPTLPLSVLDRYGQTMSQRLSTVLGVAQVQVRGIAEICGPDSARPDRPQGLRSRCRRGRHRRRCPEYQPTHGPVEQRGAQTHPPGQRPAHRGQPV